MKIFANLLIAGLFLITVGALIAALIGLDVSLPAKILVAAVILILAGILYALGSIHNTLFELLYAQRASFISLERSRLLPDDDEPALKVLTNDLREEREEKEAFKSLSPVSSLIGPVIYLGVIFVIYVSASVIYEEFFK